MDSKNYFEKSCCYLIFIAILLLSLLASCKNDWIENPSATNKTTGGFIFNYNPLWEKLSLQIPTANITVFWPHSASLNFASTANRKLYISTDNCVTWFNNYPSNLKGQIKHIYSYMKGPITYILLGTDSAIYLSQNNGGYWYECAVLYPAVNSGKVNGFYYFSDTLYTFGKFGDKNIYYSTYSGTGWYKTTLGTQGEIKAICKSLFSKDIYHLVISDGNNEKIYTKNKGSFINSLPPGVSINSIASFFSNVKNGSNYELRYIVSVGTSDGIYQSIDTGKTFSFYAMKGINVKYILSNGYYLDFIGTDNGLFYNYTYDLNDYGPYKGASIDYLYLNNDQMLYLITSKKELYRGYLQTKNNAFGISALLLFPQKNSVDVDTSITFKWINVEQENSIYYFLQVSQKYNFSENPEYEGRWLRQNYYAISSLKPKTKYYWRVLTYASLKNYSSSEVWSFTTK